MSGAWAASGARPGPEIDARSERRVRGMSVCLCVCVCSVFHLATLKASDLPHRERASQQLLSRVLCGLI
jgi:hypothetical protein